MLSFLIIDDHPMMQHGIAVLLSSNFEGAQCSACSSLEEAIDFLRKQIPDVIFLDLTLPGVTGVQAVKQLCDAYPGIPVLVFSASSEPEIVQRCIEAGAAWFLSKFQKDDEIFTVVKNLLQDKQFYSPTHQQASSKRQLQLQCVNKLTGRQIEVLRLMQQGLLNKQIAFKLDCSENTVKVHCRGVFRVLGVNNRKQATEKALSLGIFD